MNWKLILVIVLFITIYASLNIFMELFKNQDINIEQYDIQQEIINRPRVRVIKYNETIFFDHNSSKFYTIEFLTLRNDKMSINITIEYFGDVSGILATKTYYLESGETRTFCEKIYVDSNDEKVLFQIVDVVPYYD